MASKYPSWLNFQDTVVLELLHQWEKKDAEGNRKPTEILKKLSEKVEEQYEDFLALAPDPFDDRHPSQSYPECKFGDTLRLIIGEKEFMHKLTTSYFANADDDFELNCQAARLILNILSGMEGKIFEDWESIGKTCYKWSKSGKEPLRTYALDIVAVGMQNEENAGIFREDNQSMVPVVLKRLKFLKEISDLNAPAIQNFGKLSAKSISKAGSRHLRYSAGKMQKKREEEGAPSNSRVRQGESVARKGLHSIHSSQGSSSQGSSQVPSQGSQSQDVQPQGSQPQGSQPQGSQPQGSQMQDSQSHDYQSDGPQSQNSQPQGSQGSQSQGSQLQDSQSQGSQLQDSQSQGSQLQDSQSQEMKEPMLKTEEQFLNGHIDDKRSNEREDMKEQTKEATKRDEKSEIKGELNGGKIAPHALANTAWQEHFKSAKDAKNSRAKRYGYKKPNWCMWPLNVGTQQRLLLGYVTALGQYQELLMFAFEYDALDLIFYYTNVKIQKDPLLALRGLEYLSALMCHKKFVNDFVFRGGVQRLLEIPRQTTSSTGVSVCFYYLAYNDDAMEKVCLLQPPLLTDLVKYALWLVDSGIHDSARCYATLFFSLVFNFRGILDLFVSMDGLRRLINTVTVLSILRPEESRLMANDEAFGMRQIVKHTLLALKKFFCAHLSIKADEIRRKIARNKGTLLPQPIPAYKAIPLTAAQNLENVQLLLENSKEVMAWHPLLAFKKLSGIHLLFQIVSLASTGWDGYSARSEVIKLALEILFSISVSSKIQVAFCQNVSIDTDESQSGIRILIRAAEGTLVKGDGEVQKIALHILCNCVCAPKKQNNRELTREVFGYHFLNKMWTAVRMQNGIKVLLSLLNTKTPTTEADDIRCLACKALCGLSRSDRIRQVLHKLIVTFSGQLQLLMREPVLPDKINEHGIFCKYASELIETVTGKALTDHASPMAMLSTLKKADVVSQTKISYSEKELLQLIADHLKAKGFYQSATTLQREASLKCSRSHDSTQDSPFISPVPSKKRKSLSSHRSQDVALTPGDSTPNTPLIYRPDIDKVTERLDVSRASELHDNSASFQPTLDTIVTNYLREQHAHCRNPVTTCPEFSLIRPHQCPEPRNKMYAPTNILKRMFHRQIHPRHGGRMGSKLNRKFIYSRFRSVGTIEDGDGMTSFTCAKFLPDGDFILLGTRDGDVKMYNIFTGLEEGSYSCHSNPISNCESSKDLNLLLTSSTFGQPSSALWSFFNSQFFERKISFADDNFIKFNTAQDQIIGTADYTAHIYDLTTGKLSLTLTDPHNLNRYDKNIATFNYTDDLVLNDGCLWDVRAAKLLHKFDKFNDYVSGVFHPSGLEIIINSEIWDIRTYHLLDTCSSLDQCRSIFNAKGDIIYGVKHVEPGEEYDFVFGPNMFGPYDSAFRTFDSYDYSVIATTDSKKTIFDLCPDYNDSLIAVIEGSCSESICRLYEVGRLKKREDDDSDEQTEDEENEDINEEDDDEFDDALDTLEEFLLDVGDDDDDDDEEDDDNEDEDDFDDFDDDDDDDDDDLDDEDLDDDDDDDYDGDDDDVEDRDVHSLLSDDGYQLIDFQNNGSGYGS